MSSSNEYIFIIGDGTFLRQDNNSYHRLTFDGACKHNPGPCSGGYIIWQVLNNEWSKMCSGGIFVGSSGTNNVAEYSGLISGLEKCVTENVKDLLIEGDSLLVINQICGKWKVKDQKMCELHAKTLVLLKKFNNVGVQHILRKFNSDADAEANKWIQ